MPRVGFDRLPDDGRLWIFAAERELSPAEQARLLAEVDQFIAQWTAHGVALTAARELREGRFLFVGVDERAAGVSGCSIDALVRRMRTLQGELGAELVNHGPVLFRRHGRVERLSRERFAELAAAGDVGIDTPVFDTTLTRIGDLRAGRWEVPARESWHGRAFF